MNHTPIFMNKIGRSWLVIVGLLLLLASTGMVSASAVMNAAQPTALVRIDLQNNADLEGIAAAGVNIYAQLFRSDGGAYVLAAVNPTQQALLSQHGYIQQLLDRDTQNQEYYLVYAHRPVDLEQARSLVTFLAEDYRQALIRATPSQAEQLPPLGIELRQLILHPIVLPSSGQSAVIPEVITPDPLVAEMIAQVKSTTVNTYDGNLSGEWPVNIGGTPFTIATRYTSTKSPIQKATQFTYEHFQSLGLPVAYHQYKLSGSGRKSNVIAEQTGLTEPGRIFLITAHLDDTSQRATRKAPGADDNASGSTAVMIAADILSQYDFGCTIRYALFTGEEQGLVGSYYYARDAASRGDNIEGVLNLDMISYNKDGNPILDLHTRPGNADDLAIANLFADVVSAYNINLTPNIFQDAPYYSDHASFWEFGFPAIIGIEDDHDFTPYYHTTQDKLSTLNVTYFTEFVKAAVGTFAHMSCLLDQ